MTRQELKECLLSGSPIPAWGVIVILIECVALFAWTYRW